MRKFIEAAFAIVLVVSTFVLWFSWFETGPQLASGFTAEQNAVLGSSGAIGDSFGPLNALFAAFGFTAIIATLLLQRRDLARQQEQIVQGQKDQARQSFERTFFELLHLFRAEREQLRFRHSLAYTRHPTNRDTASRDMKVGRVAIRTAVIEARFWIHDLLELGLLDKTRVVETYRRRIHGRYEASLGPYFRILYNILNRIREADFLTEDEKIAYGNLVRGQLTSHEVALAGLNGLAPFANDFHSLVEEFRLLKYLPEGEMKKALQLFYPPKTFESRTRQPIPSESTVNQPAS